MYDMQFYVITHREIYVVQFLSHLNYGQENFLCTLTLFVICHLFVIFLVLFRNLSKVYVCVEMTNTSPIFLHKAAPLT